MSSPHPTRPVQQKKSLTMASVMSRRSTGERTPIDTTWLSWGRSKCCEYETLSEFAGVQILMCLVAEFRFHHHAGIRIDLRRQLGRHPHVC